MALSTDIYTILRANNDIVTTFATRIYPVVAPQAATYPYLVYTLTGLTTNESKSFANKWDDCSVTTTVFHTNITDAETYGNYMRTAMNRYKASISSDVIIGCVLQSSSWDGLELIADNSPTGILVFAVMMQWKLMVRQNITE
jgi:hypothetical protein